MIDQVNHEKKMLTESELDGWSKNPDKIAQIDIARLINFVCDNWRIMHQPENISTTEYLQSLGFINSDGVMNLGDCKIIPESVPHANIRYKIYLSGELIYTGAWPTNGKFCDELFEHLGIVTWRRVKTN